MLHLYCQLMLLIDCALCGLGLCACLRRAEIPTFPMNHSFQMKLHKVIGPKIAGL